MRKYYKTIGNYSRVDINENSLLTITNDVTLNRKAIAYHIENDKFVEIYNSILGRLTTDDSDLSKNWIEIGEGEFNTIKQEVFEYLNSIN
jgi:CRISPR/Cas system CSM-associated protein Csm2 small subunit